MIRRTADACRTDEDIDVFNFEVLYYFTYNSKVSNTRRYDGCWWPKDGATFRVVHHHQTCLTMLSYLNVDVCTHKQLRGCLRKINETANIVRSRF